MLRLLGTASFIVVLALTAALPLPAATDDLADMRPTVEDLPAGFELESRYEPVLPPSVPPTATSGGLFRKELRPHVLLLLGSNLYTAESAAQAGILYERLAGPDPDPVDGLGTEATLRESGREGDRTATGVAVLFRRGPVVALLVATAVDGNAAPEDRLEPGEVLESEALLDVARRFDRRIADALIEDPR